MWHWNVIFMTGSVATIIGAVLFLVWGTAERQDWSTPDAQVDENDDQRPLVDPV